MATVFVYDRNGTFKMMLQSGAGPMLRVKFTLGRKGCAGFELEFAEPVSIVKSDKVKILLMDVEDPFYMGVVRSVPIAGSSARQYVYSGFGMNDYFYRLNAGALTYAGQSLTAIVTDLVDTVITVKSIITKDAAKISLPAINVTSFVSNYAQVSEVLDALKNIADSSGTEYNYGVDEEGDFFFRERDASTVATLVVGKRGPYGILAYDPVDEQEQRTALEVLRQDGTWLQKVSSTLGNDIYEEKVTGPEIDDTSLALWATGILFEKERTVRSAVVEWPIDPSMISRVAPKKGLLCYYPLDVDPDGANKVYDASGNGRFITMANSPVTGEGVAGKSIYLPNGSSKCGVTNDDPFHNLTECTWSWWQRRDTAAAVANQAIASNYVANRGYIVGYTSADPKWISWFIYDDAGVGTSGTYIYAGDWTHWHHVGIRYRAGDRVQIWLDGTMVKETTVGIAPSIGSPVAPTKKFGSYDVPGNFPGWIDEYRAYSRYLADDEMRRLARYPAVLQALDRIVADGHVRILSGVPPISAAPVTAAPWGDGNWGDGLWNGAALGGWTLDDTLALYEITYEIAQGQATRKLALGALPPRFEGMIAELRKKIADLEVVLGV